MRGKDILLNLEDKSMGGGAGPLRSGDGGKDKEKGKGKEKKIGKGTDKDEESDK